MKAKQLFCSSLIAALGTFAMPNPVFAANILVVNKIQDSLDGSCDVADCSLREAMAAAQFGDSIEFSALFIAPQTIVLNGANLVFSSSIMLKGPGRDLLTISGNQQSRIFFIPDAYSVSISNLSITNGFTSGAGGGIFAFGHLEMRNVTIAQNRAVQLGSGTMALDGFNINNDVILKTKSPNHSSEIYDGDSIRGLILIPNRTGGGIYIGKGGSLTLIDSTISNNIAGMWGGGIYNNEGTLNVYESTIVGNTAEWDRHYSVWGR